MNSVENMWSELATQLPESAECVKATVRCDVSAGYVDVEVLLRDGFMIHVKGHMETVQGDESEDNESDEADVFDEMTLRILVAAKNPRLRPGHAHSSRLLERDVGRRGL